MLGTNNKGEEVLCLIFFHSLEKYKWFMETLNIWTFKLYTHTLKE